MGQVPKDEDMQRSEFDGANSPTAIYSGLQYFLLMSFAVSLLASPWYNIRLIYFPKGWHWIIPFSCSKAILLGELFLKVSGRPHWESSDSGNSEKVLGRIELAVIQRDIFKNLVRAQ